jgi:hypothetical protein
VTIENQENSLSEMYHRLTMKDEESDRKFPFYLLGVALFWVVVIVMGYYSMTWFLNI